MCGARVVLAPALGKSDIGRLFGSCLTFYLLMCKAVLEGRGFKPIFLIKKSLTSNSEIYRCEALEFRIDVYWL
jgi:hypothetical protein